MIDFEERRDELLEKIEEMTRRKQYKALRDILVELEPADIADLFDDLPEEMLPLLFRLLPKEPAAELFVELEPDVQEMLIRGFSNTELKEVLDELYLDDAVDIVEEMPAGVVKRILKNCDENKRALINQFLRYPENSAGSIMTIEYMDFHVGTTVGQAMESIRQNAPDKETINTLYILDDRRVLLGTVALRKLLLSRDDCKVEQLMNTQVISVRTTDDQELVADTVRKYDLLSIPVVDHENRMVGIVTVDDIVDVIEEENTEDFEKMAAMLPSDDTYLKTSVLTLAKNRLPWLMILMISALFTGQIITHFESVLQNAASIGVALVASIPMLMDTGGNCGSQASTLAIRGLALGEIEPKNLWQVLWKELRVAMLLGVALASVNFLRIAFLTNYGTNVALIISLTMFCTIVIAKLIGGSLPLLAKAVHLDPALMASPLITTMVDAASLTILFTIATRIFHVGAA